MPMLMPTASVGCARVQTPVRVGARWAWYSKPKIPALSMGICTFSVGVAGRAPMPRVLPFEDSDPVWSVPVGTGRVLEAQNFCSG